MRQDSRPPQNLRSELRLALKSRGSDEAVAIWSRKGQREVFTGDMLSDISETIAKDMRAWLGDGAHTVILALPSGIDFIGTMLGAILADITIVPVPLPRMGALSDRFQQIVSDSDASAIFCLSKHEGLLNSVLPVGVATSCQILPLPLPSSGSNIPAAVSTGANAQAPALIQYTSGSTRAPKGVKVMGRNILANSDLVQRNWGLGPKARVVNWLPHYHDMGLMGGILYPLLAGGFSAQIDPLDFIRRPAFWLEVIDSERANFSGGAAFGYSEVLRRVSAEKIKSLDLSCWENAYCGAEPVPSGLLPAFYTHLEQTGFPDDASFACYGMAEITLFTAGVRKATKQKGKVAPCHLTPELTDLIAIVDPESHRQLPAGQEGEIWLRGPSQTEGYLNNLEETTATFDQTLEGQMGWMRTGDLGYKLNDALYIVGRIKEIVICNGRNIAAPEIEWLGCQQHPLLNPMSAAAFSANPNTSEGAILIAELHSKNLTQLEIDEIRQKIRLAVRGEMGLNLIDVVLVARGRLERTSSGKIRRGAVATAWRSNHYKSVPVSGEI